MHRDKPRPTTPDCARCPKEKLYPGHHGLHPANQVAVQMYHLAARDQRCGMDNLLLTTLTPESAWAVINGYAPIHFPTQVEKTQVFELMTVLDEVVTRVRSEDEQHRREQQARANRSHR